ncbi:MAG: hypothetical protein HGA16_00505 [Candidatus Moranbacteria bacterium]|nr:hypothetical protein [Candidatus Moranbacteria bacterium]
MEVSNIVAVFTSEPPAALLSAAVVKPDSHGKGRVWLVSGAALDGATLQILGVGSEWGQVLNQADGSIIHNGQTAVALQYVGENGWQLSTGKVVFGDGSWAWASKVWPHNSYEAYDAKGNPVNVWGAGTANLGAPAPEAVKAAIRENLPVPN